MQSFAAELNAPYHVQQKQQPPATAGNSGLQAVQSALIQQDEYEQQQPEQDDPLSGTQYHYTQHHHYDQHRRQIAYQQPDFFAERGAWYEQCLPAGCAGADASVAGGAGGAASVLGNCGAPGGTLGHVNTQLWLCAANPAGRARQMLRQRIARTRHSLRKRGRRAIAAAPPQAPQTTIKSELYPQQQQHLGASWMVSVSGFVETASVGAPLKTQSADVVGSFLIGGDAVEAIVVVYVNNKLAVYNLMNKTYIPTIESVLPIAQNSVPTCAAYDPSTLTVLVGTNRGIIVACQIDPGLNSMHKISVSEKSFAESIDCLKYLPKSNVILATNTYFLYIYDAQSLVVTQQYPSQSQTKATYSYIEVSPNEDRLFLGTHKGTVEIIDHNKGRCMLTNTLPGHKSEITCIHFASDKSILFTADNYGHIQMWHMQAGFQMINLFYHTTNVIAMRTFHYNEKDWLASLCRGNYLVFWDLSRSRNGPVAWHENSECESCTKPFFWNVKKLFELRQIAGYRRHHCRSCGKSLCKNCVAEMDRIPHFGLELKSNACFDCKASYRPEDLETGVVVLKPDDSKLLKADFGTFTTEDGKQQNAIITLGSSFFQRINVMTLNFN